MDTSRALPKHKKEETLSYPVTIKFFAELISYFFHPLFIPLYVTWYLEFIHPGYFIGFDERLKWLVFTRTVINMFFFPLLTVLLLKGVRFIDSIFLRTQRDRVIPYIAVGIFFFWMFLVFRNQNEIPVILTAFIFSVFLSSSLALLVNIYLKVSMHAIGVGGMLGLILIVLLTNTSYPVTLPLMVTILICGVVCTARMIASDHTQKEIYVGLLCGLLCQFIGSALIR